MALRSPIGSAMTDEPAAITKVPQRSGRIPKLGGFPSGLSTAPNRKLQGLTPDLWKNATDSTASTTTMPTVVKMLTIAQRLRMTQITLSRYPSSREWPLQWLVSRIDRVEIFELLNNCRISRFVGRWTRRNGQCL